MGSPKTEHEVPPVAQSPSWATLYLESDSLLAPSILGLTGPPNATDLRELVALSQVHQFNRNLRPPEKACNTSVFKDRARLRVFRVQSIPKIDGFQFGFEDFDLACHEPILLPG